MNKPTSLSGSELLEWIADAGRDLRDSKPGDEHVQIKIQKAMATSALVMSACKVESLSIQKRKLGIVFSDQLGKVTGSPLIKQKLQPV